MSEIKFGDLLIDQLIEDHPRVVAAKKRLVQRLDIHTKLLEEVHNGLRAQHALNVLSDFSAALTGQTSIIDTEAKDEAECKNKKLKPGKNYNSVT